MYVAGTVFSRVVSDTVKGAVEHLTAPAACVARAGEAAVPAWVVFPKYEAGAPPALAPLGRAGAFMQLAANSFNYTVLGQAGFDALGAIVGRSACYSFTYSALDDALDTFAQLARAPA